MCSIQFCILLVHFPHLIQFGISLLGITKFSPRLRIFASNFTPRSYEDHVTYFAFGTPRIKIILFVEVLLFPLLFSHLFLVLVFAVRWITNSDTSNPGVDDYQVPRLFVLACLLHLRHDPVHPDHTPLLHPKTEIQFVVFPMTKIYRTHGVQAQLPSTLPLAPYYSLSAASLSWWYLPRPTPFPPYPVCVVYSHPYAASDKKWRQNLRKFSLFTCILPHFLLPSFAPLQRSITSRV
ncbi:uncharacterized protein FOMMEDRAFT_162369 [Fomitiporia mediterranea MF3/22]|uniref:uncharacterized protein n=1 Tax=Fomitiporia mediterranea (strain MF3/22) TaxID=694068 RepID=UPI00044076E6|nr:uncharacterized protein FOMMEDRAFT_162369 [Fomitiporia mediterranea MF3/22]EJC98025.1 hypothetical protein FOMMEDRAFT_162369 [Fomitiporia mediterranea MF3/22]